MGWEVGLIHELFLQSGSRMTKRSEDKVLAMEYECMYE
jgi:hypothetical protein